MRALLVETWHDTYDRLIGAERVTELTDSWHSPEALSRQLAMDGTAFLVARDGGAIAGHLFADGRHMPVLLVRRVYVRPARQRQGIGTRLLQAAAAAFPQAEAMRLDVEADNAKGLAFYRREGFVVIAEKVEAGIPHLVMEKRLGR